MSTRYKRIIEYSEGQPSEYNENADSVGAAIDRELKFCMNASWSDKKQLVSIEVRPEE